MPTTSLLLLSSLLFATTLLAENPWDALDSRQQELLKSGKQVTVAEQVSGVPWPSLHVYRLLKATPEQAAAVFWDVQYAPHYVPDCLNVTLEGSSKTNVITLQYEVRVPFLPKDVSQVRDELNQLPGGGYKISWDVLESTYSKSGKGSFVVLPHDQGTLMCYSNFVNPGSAIALLLKGEAQRRVETIAAAIAHQIESEAQQPSGQLATQMGTLKEALQK